MLKVKSVLKSRRPKPGLTDVYVRMLEDYIDELERAKADLEYRLEVAEVNNERMADSATRYRDSAAKAKELVNRLSNDCQTVRLIKCADDKVASYNIGHGFAALDEDEWVTKSPFKHCIMTMLFDFRAYRLDDATINELYLAAFYYRASDHVLFNMKMRFGPPADPDLLAQCNARLI